MQSIVRSCNVYIKLHVMKGTMQSVSFKRSAATFEGTCTLRSEESGLQITCKWESEDYKLDRFNFHGGARKSKVILIVVMRMLTFRKINHTVERGGAEGIMGSTWKILRASVFDELREQNLDLLWPRGASLYCETTDSTDRVVFLLQIIIEQDHKRSLSK